MILKGDCVEKMKELEDNSIDTVICDPPYGIGFMGKEWDRFDPERIKRQTEKSDKGYKVKSDNPNLRGRKAAGFARKATLAGTYDLSQKGLNGFQQWMTEIAKEMLRVAKPGATLLIFGGTRTYHRMACAIEDAGWVLKDCIIWLYGQGFPKATDISKQLDKGHEREVIGKKRASIQSPKEFNNGKGAFGSYPEETKIIDITTPSTPEAKLWNGWKSHGLKPAYEPILVAQKPNEGTYANNALKWGVSGLNIDGGRIGTEKHILRGGGGGKGTGWGKKNEINEERIGRFPANILMSCYCDYQLKSGIIKENKKKLIDWLYENS